MGSKLSAAAVRHECYMRVKEELSSWGALGTNALVHVEQLFGDDYPKGYVYDAYWTFVERDREVK